MVYKSINNLVPKYLCNLFTKNSSRDIITLRNSELDLYVPFMNTKSGQKSFSYRGAHFWNGLKPTSKNAPSLFASKRAIKQKLKKSFLESLIRIYLFPYIKDCNLVDTCIYIFNFSLSLLILHFRWRDP